jgi:signal transduction histidine kinase
MSSPTNRQQADELRRGAERRLVQQQRNAVAAAVDSTRQLHELQVHQIELEMQNEALMQAHANTEDALRQLGELNGELETLVASRTAELVAARDAAEAGSRAKTSFLANMSHELRTPLNGVMGMVGLAMGRASDAKQAEWLRTAMLSAEHLLTVVNDVLDISKIEAGRLSLLPVDFELGEVLDELIAMLRHSAESKGLALTCDLPAALARQRLYGDSFRLKQILLNLLGNAVKFTDAGTVGLHVQWVQESSAGLQLRFEVRDTGIGIAPDDQTRLFSAFEQADSSSTRRFEGTGLGLAISSRLVHMMGGLMGVDSVPGVGSSFWFTACLGHAEAEVERDEPPAQTAHAGRDAPGADWAGLRVLLVEDDATNRVIATAMLECAGLLVDLAHDGAIAVAMARATPLRADHDGPADAGDGRRRRLPRHPADAGTRHYAHRGADRQRVRRGPAAVPGCRHGRSPVQAHPHRGVGRCAAEVATEAAVNGVTPGRTRPFSTRFSPTAGQDSDKAGEMQCTAADGGRGHAKGGTWRQTTPLLLDQVRSPRCRLMCLQIMGSHQAHEVAVRRGVHAEAGHDRPVGPGLGAQREQARRWLTTGVHPGHRGSQPACAFSAEKRAEPKSHAIVPADAQHVGPGLIQFVQDHCSIDGEAPDGLAVVQLDLTA